MCGHHLSLEEARHGKSLTTESTAAAPASRAGLSLGDRMLARPVTTVTGAPPVKFLKGENAQNCLQNWLKMQIPGPHGLRFCYSRPGVGPRNVYF